LISIYDEKDANYVSAGVARWHISKPKYQFGKILEGLAIEDVGPF
jgi:hypothetical protein